MGIRVPALVLYLIYLGENYFLVLKMVVNIINIPPIKIAIANPPATKSKVLLSMVILFSSKIRHYNL
ncbi:hypothetical protein AA650_06040 [Anabaena sp. WA102]|nr:hypothetical protein AA650_06040 [Anabaena sp. WA102]OBQ16498.1 MAG: hypothetical protein AN486_18775 [Anabaena sp. AL93]